MAREQKNAASMLQLTLLAVSDVPGSKIPSRHLAPPLRKVARGLPVEVAEVFVFLASNGASYMTAQTIHVNGGEVVNGKPRCGEAKLAELPGLLLFDQMPNIFCK